MQMTLLNTDQTRSMRSKMYFDPIFCSSRSELVGDVDLEMIVDRLFKLELKRLYMALLELHY